MKLRSLTALLLAVVLCIGMAVPALAAGKINVTSDSTAKNGRLLTVCANTSAGGKNQVPQVSWDAVDGASAYALYIFDRSAGNWCHWIALVDGDTTSVSQGEKLGNSRYKGPYPPSGTHQYQITVYALEKTPSSLPGKFDAKNDISSVESILSQSNILAKGTVTVPYANGDRNV